MLKNVDNFSKYPSVDGRLLTKYKLHNFDPKTREDLLLLQIAEDVIDRKKVSEMEGWPIDGNYNGKNTNIGKVWARDYEKIYPENGYPIFTAIPTIRRTYNLKTKKYETKIFAFNEVFTANTLKAEGKEKVEAELKEIFSK